MESDEEDAGWGGKQHVTTASTPKRLFFFLPINAPWQVHPCPSSCSIQAAFPATDSGAYWCETGLGETSDMFNITVTGE